MRKGTDQCLSGAGSQIMEDFIHQPTTVERMCSTLSPINEQACMSGASSFYLLYTADPDTTDALCASLSHSRNRSTCNQIVDRSKKMF